MEEPKDLRSENGVLEVDLAVHDEKQSDGSLRYCYVLGDGRQSPTLRLQPGELLILRLRNQLSDPTRGDAEAKQPRTAHRHSGGALVGHEHADHGRDTAPDPCNSGVMTLTSTNLHFHGLTLPPVCHQDEVFKTSIQPTDPPFEYRFRIPADEPPGLYWYHPHIHGFSSRQVLGGASGALIVEGIERANPEVATLPERVFVIRDQDLLHPQAPLAESADRRAGGHRPRRRRAQYRDGHGPSGEGLSVNFVPVPYPDYPTATVTMKPASGNSGACSTPPPSLI